MPSLGRFVARVGLAALLGAAAAGAGSLVATDAQAQAPRARPWLGVSMDDAKNDGVRVRHVIKTSPAEKAGVRSGDRILRVGSAAVTRSSEVIRAVAMLAPGDAVTLTIGRDGKEVAAKVTLGAFPSSEDMMRMDFVGSPAPAWKGVEPVSGSVPANIANLKGRVVVLAFWATWCGACKMASPRLSDLQARYGAQGLSIIGLANEEPDEVSHSATGSTARYAIGVDRKGETSNAYHVASLPSVFIIDKKGVVRDVSVGYDPGREAQVETLLKSLLAEPAPAP